MNKKLCLICNLAIILCTLALISCSKHNILSEQKIEEVLYDIYLTEAMYDVKYTDFNSEDRRYELFSSVLKKHNITKPQLDSSLIWYSDNPEVFIRVNDSVMSKLKQDIKSLDIKYVEQKNNENTALAFLPAYFYLSLEQPLLRFNIDSLEISKYRNFEFNVSTLSALPQDSLLLSIVYIYKDTTITDSQYLTTNTSYRIKNKSTFLFEDLKSIYGSLYVDPLKLKDRNILLSGLSI